MNGRSNFIFVIFFDFKLFFLNKKRHGTCYVPASGVK